MAARMVSVAPWLCLAAARAADPLPSCPSDWKLEVIAVAPEVRYPTVAACTPDGRVLVGEDPMDIVAPADQTLGRIVCFHPDGRRTVFAEGLHAVFGLQYLEGKVFVLHNPKLTVYRDGGDVGTDPVDLIESTNPNPWALDWNDHIPAGFRLAMDGYFYLSVGDKGIYKARGRDGKVVSLFGGGTLRLRPDATELEVFTTGTRNHLDAAINAEDEVFTYDNTDEKDWWSRVTHMVDGGYYGYPFDHKPPQPWILPCMTDYGAGAATACFVYEEDALPDEYRGNIVLADWGRREVFRLRVVRDGATYRVAERKDLLFDAPGDFHPVGLALTPDGASLFVTDWRHADVKTTGVVAGRLLKLSYTGQDRAAPRPAWHRAAEMGRPFDATEADLLAALRHPARSVRLCAQRRIAERGRGLVEPLAALLGDAGAPAPARWHALWALDAIDGGASARASIVAALKDRDPSVRRQAARQLATRRADGAAPALRGLLDDEEPSVRFHAASALGRIGNPSGVPKLLERLEDDDAFARFAAWTALGRIGRARPEAWREIASGLASDRPRVREGTLFALRETPEIGLVDALVGVFDDSRSTDEARATALRLLAGVQGKLPEWKGEWWAYHPVLLPRPRKSIPWEGTEKARAALLRGLGHPSPGVVCAAVEGLCEPGETRAAEAIRPLLLSPRDPLVERAALRALGALKDAGSAPIIAERISGRSRDLEPEMIDAAESIGGDVLAASLARALRNGAAASRLPRCLEALGKIGGDAAIDDIAPFLLHADAAVARAAAAALGRLRSPRAVPALVGAFAREDLRLELARALAATPDARAVDAYVFGLESGSAVDRDLLRKAVAAVSREALPILERKAGAGELGARALVELRRVYAVPRPISRWRVSGPLPPGDPPFDPALNGGDLGAAASAWEAAAAGGEGYVDLSRVLPAGRAGVAYALGEVESASARAVELLVGSDGKLGVWLNGQLVHESRGGKPWRRDAGKPVARLAAGKNRVLVRCESEGGPAGFSVCVPEPGAGPLWKEEVKESDPTLYLDYALKHDGNPARGFEVYSDPRRGSCVKCHAVAGKGGAVGPDLGGIGKQYDRAGLAENVLFPSKVVRPDYQQMVIVLQSGDAKAGLVRAETADELTLIDAEGARHTIKKSEVAAREPSPLSLMPEGLSTGMSLDDFADLLTYLESLRAGSPNK